MVEDSFGGTMCVMIGNSYDDIDKIKTTVYILKNLITAVSVDPGRLSGMDIDVVALDELYKWYTNIYFSMSILGEGNANEPGHEIFC